MFEASFPVRLENSKGNKLAEVPAQAQEDWMTEDFVDFEVELKFKQPDTTIGTLLFEKANPSGLPENADQVKIPVRFE